MAEEKDKRSVSRPYANARDVLSPELLRTVQQHFTGLLWGSYPAAGRSDIPQRLPRFSHQVQPQAPGILRRLDHHLTGRIAPRLRLASNVDAGGKGEFCS